MKIGAVLLPLVLHASVAESQATTAGAGAHRVRRGLAERRVPGDRRACSSERIPEPG